MLGFSDFGKRVTGAKRARTGSGVADLVWEGWRRGGEAEAQSDANKHPLATRNVGFSGAGL